MTKEPNALVHDLLEKLRECAHQLLLAYDDTGRVDIEMAFEKTAEACQILYLNQEAQQNMTMH